MNIIFKKTPFVGSLVNSSVCVRRSTNPVVLMYFVLFELPKHSWQPVFEQDKKRMCTLENIHSYSVIRHGFCFFSEEQTAVFDEDFLAFGRAVMQILGPNGRSMAPSIAHTMMGLGIG